jgi:DNA-binding XRE family transcriptional regulator
MTTAKKLNQAICATIYNCRKEKGLTKSEFALYLEIPYRSYCYYEIGDQEPTLEVVIKICNKLEISLSNMLGLTT